MKNEVPVNEHILFVKEMLWALATHGENPLHTNQRIMEAVNGLCHAIVDAFEPEAKGNGDITTPVMGILHWALPAIEAIYEETPEVYPEIRAMGTLWQRGFRTCLGRWRAGTRWMESSPPSLLPPTGRQKSPVAKDGEFTLRSKCLPALCWFCGV